MIVKDPNKSVIRLYDIPDSTFEDSDDDDDDDEDIEGKFNLLTSLLLINDIIKYLSTVKLCFKRFFSQKPFLVLKIRLVIIFINLKAKFTKIFIDDCEARVPMYTETKSQTDLGSPRPSGKLIK